MHQTHHLQIISVFRHICRLLIVCFALSLAGCSAIGDVKESMSEKIFGKEDPNPPAVLADFKPTVEAKIQWHIKVGDTGTFDFTPVVDTNAVFAASTDGDIVKVNLATGVQEWRINAGEKLSGGVGIGQGTTGQNIVLVGTVHGAVLAYDYTGKVLWKAKLSSEVLSAPRVFDGVVIVRSADNHIVGLNANDGSRKWVYQRASPALSLRSSAGLVVDGGAVYAGFAGGKMVALRADNGNILWEATVAQPKGVTEIERIADITSLPVVDSGLVYAVAYQGKIAAIDRKNGRAVWSRDISSLNGLTTDAGKVFVSHTAGSVYALDDSAGKTFWRQPGLLNRKITSPISLGAIVAVGDFEGYVHFLNREDGAFAARIKTDSSAVMPQMVAIGNSQVVAQTRDGGLFAISLK